MRGLVAALALMVLPGVASAQVCRLALSLALDVSSSVDGAEYRLQSDGMATALVSPPVVDAIFQIPGTTIALHVFEWSGTRQQRVVIDWTLIRDEAHLAEIAARVRGAVRSTDEFPTAIGFALGFARAEMQRAPQCDRQVIDVSGDGTNNDGFPPRLAYANSDFSAITVNGLVIGGSAEGLAEYYRRSVIHGPGAFVEEAESYRDYARAIERKLVREIREAQVTSRD